MVLIVHAGKLMLLLVLLLAHLSESRHVRTRRSVDQFADMVSHYVHRKAVLYLSYGNYCGSTFNYDVLPVDEVDKCCLQHDMCYKATRTAECWDSWIVLYFTRYSWSREGNTITCKSDAGTCGRALCDCDKTATECFARHPYIKQHKHGSILDWFA